MAGSQPSSSVSTVAHHHTRRTADVKVLTLDRGEGTTLTIQLQGCVISSWRFHNIEQLFVPVTADYSYLVRFKGGITLTFPYAPHSEVRETYELSRLYNWKVFLGPKFTSKGDVTATFLMKDDLWTRSVWDYPFLFFYKVTLRQRSVTCDLRVVNTGKDLPFDFKFHLNVNFQVENVNEWKLEGLQNEIYSDKNVNNIPYLENTVTDEKDAVTYGRKMYRVYQPCLPGAPLYFLKKRDECEVRRDGLDPFKRIVKITKLNFPDVTVRYPWSFQDKHTDILRPKHLINDAKRDAVTVGTGYVSKAKKLQSGDMYRAVMKISILPEEKLTTTMAELEVTDLQTPGPQSGKTALAESSIPTFLSKENSTRLPHVTVYENPVHNGPGSRVFVHGANELSTLGSITLYQGLVALLTPFNPSGGRENYAVWAADSNDTHKKLSSLAYKYLRFEIVTYHLT